MLLYWIGWVGVALGLCVPIPQLIKIKKTGMVDGISIWTYAILIVCLVCYLLHAIYIKSLVFSTAQAFNLLTNGAILVMLIRKRSEV